MLQPGVVLGAPTAASPLKNFPPAVRGARRRGRLDEHPLLRLLQPSAGVAEELLLGGQHLDGAEVAQALADATVLLDVQAAAGEAARARARAWARAWAREAPRRQGESAARADSQRNLSGLSADSRLRSRNDSSRDVTVSHHKQRVWFTSVPWQQRRRQRRAGGSAARGQPARRGVGGEGKGKNFLGISQPRLEDLVHERARRRRAGAGRRRRQGALFPLLLLQNVAAAVEQEVEELVRVLRRV